MFDWITDPNAWLALGTLTLLEIILGIDNIVFLSLVVAKLPAKIRERARFFGLLGAMVTRLALLSMGAWISHLVEPLFILASRAVSARDLLMLLGGLFLLWKATHEIYATIEGDEEQRVSRSSSLWRAVLTIMILDMVFSLDSVITAVGLSPHLFIMMAAVIISVIVMMFSAKSIGGFIEQHSSVKILALSFLLLVGFTLLLDGFHIDVPKAYIYFAMFFSMTVEGLNLWYRHRHNKK